MKKLFIALGIISMFAFSFADETNTEINNVKQEVKEIKSDVKEVKDGVEEVKSMIKEVHAADFLREPKPALTFNFLPAFVEIIDIGFEIPSSKNLSIDLGFFATLGSDNSFDYESIYTIDFELKKYTKSDLSGGFIGLKLKANYIKEDGDYYWDDDDYEAQDQDQEHFYGSIGLSTGFKKRFSDNLNLMWGISANINIGDLPEETKDIKVDADIDLFKLYYNF